MMSLLLESAVRSLVLGIVVWIVLALLRVRSPAAQSFTSSKPGPAAVAMAKRNASPQQRTA